MKRKYGVFAAVLLLPLLLASGCSPESKTGNLISTQWSYAVGSPDDTVKDASGYQYKTLESLTNLNTYVKGDVGFIWLKNSFAVSKEYDERQVAANLGRISLADESYLNGVLIGSEGRFPPNFFSAWNTYRLYLIPVELLKKGSENTFLVKIFVNHEGAVYGDLYVGRYSIARNLYDYEQFINTDLTAIISFLIFMIGLLYLQIYLKRRKDRENLFYALSCFTFALYLTNFYMMALPSQYIAHLSYLSQQKFVFAILNITVLMVILFIHAILKRPINKIVLVILLLCVIVPTIGFMIQPDYDAFCAVKGPLQLTLLVLLLYVIIILVVASLKKNREVLVVILGLAPLFATNIFDIIFLQILKMPGWPYLSGYGFPAFLFAMAAILTNRFVHDRNEAEELNVSLELKVEERTKQLQAANDELGAAMEELEAINETLTKTNRDLEDAQRIAARDMKMAVNVQSSMFMKKPPVTDAWDVAYIFKPMSGVSGDLYDFYMKDDRFSGLGLFDVSGHGIASGLITMLAKSVIFRNYTRHIDLPLHKVVMNINTDLISELGSVDNYLTGIMIRFDGDAVEYVNAGHTELLLKKTGSDTRIVKPKNDDIKGLFLGVAGMESQYKSLQFKLAKEDYLLLYSDCLIESVNEGKDPYGIERVMASMNRAPGGLTASGLLNFILEDFYAFTGSIPLNDDLTAILIRRK